MLLLHFHAEYHNRFGKPRVPPRGRPGLLLCRKALAFPGEMGDNRVYLKTVNTPNSGSFPPAGYHFFLQYAEYSCKKVASSGGKSLAASHIPGFQIDPKITKFLVSNSKARKRKLSGFCDFYIVSKAGFWGALRSFRQTRSELHRGHIVCLGLGTLFQVLVEHGGGGVPIGVQEQVADAQGQAAEKFPADKGELKQK